MDDKLVTFKTAKLAKEKGFDVKVRFSYGKKEEISKESLNSFKDANFNFYKGTYWQISAPTQTALQRWLRERHKLFVFPHIVYFEPETWMYKIWGQPMISIEGELIKGTSYEESLEEGLQEALNMLPNI